MSARKPQPRVATFRMKESVTEGVTEWLSLAALALAGFALLLLTTVGLNAQQFQSQAEYREAALRMHRERIASMMEERRQEREAEQAQPTATQASGPTPTTSSQVTVRGSAQLLSWPLNVVCHVGDRFLSTVLLHNTAATEVDQIKVCLRYDPQVLRLNQISDRSVRANLASPPAVAADLSEGWFTYSASLERPQSGIQLEVLTIEWEALVPTPRSLIDLSLRDGTPSEMRRGGRDVLGEVGDPADGTLGTQIAIRPLDDDRLRGALLINDLSSLRAVQGMDPQGGVTLSLAPQSHEVRVGETFAVDVRLSNPMGSAIDDVRFALRYDPAVLEVLDAAPSEHRRPGDNWIVGGVNLHDAPFQREYPFDFHLRNEAQNATGLADYRMGLSRPRPLPGGTIARVYLRALAPASETAIQFIHGDDPRLPTTMIRCLGVDVLGEIGRASDGTSDLRLRVGMPDMAASASPSVPPRATPSDSPSGG